MSRILQICLMVLTAALGVVCLIQWQRESRVAAYVTEIKNQLGLARETMADQTARLAAWEKEIARLTAALAAQSEASRRLPQLEAQTVEARQQWEAGQALLTQQQASLASLHEQLEKALDERDALAGRLNERTKEFNALADKYRTGR